MLNTGQVNFPQEFIIDRGKEPICHVNESLRNCEKSIQCTTGKKIQLVVTGILSPKVNYLNVYHNHSDN